LSSRRDIAQIASARRDRLLNLARGRGIAARDLLRHGEARREVVQALVPAQREFDRDGAAGVDHVDRRPVVDRLEEAAEFMGRRLAAKGSQIYRY